MICFLAFVLLLSWLRNGIEAAPRPGDPQVLSHSLPQLPPVPPNTSSSPSPTLIRILLAVMVLPVVFNTIAARLGRLSNQHPRRPGLLYAQATALYASYSVGWFAGIVLWITGYLEASFDVGEAGFAVLLLLCSGGYLTQSVSWKLRHLLWHIPDFIRLHRQEVDGVVQNFRALLYLAFNEDPPNNFAFDQRLALVVYALTKGHERVLQILRRNMSPSVNCSHNIRELQQRLSDFDALPQAVQHLVPEALASLVELAVEQEHSDIVAFGSLIERVRHELQHGHMVALNTCTGAHLGRNCPACGPRALGVLLEL